MATANLSVLSYDGGLCEIHLVYDTLTLAVSQVAGANNSPSDAFVQITNGAQQFSGTFRAGLSGSFTVPAGKLTLTQQAQPDGSTALSYAPWSISSRWPA